MKRFGKQRLGGRGRMKSNFLIELKKISYFDELLIQLAQHLCKSGIFV
jgi:hypothetical protein